MNAAVAKFTALLDAVAWAILPYDMHMPSVSDDGQPIVKQFTGKLYLVCNWYIVIAKDNS
jgi:hypothetical protein